MTKSIQWMRIEIIFILVYKVLCLLIIVAWWASLWFIRAFSVSRRFTFSHLSCYCFSPFLLPYTISLTSLLVPWPHKTKSISPKPDPLPVSFQPLLLSPAQQTQSSRIQMSRFPPHSMTQWCFLPLYWWATWKVQTINAWIFPSIVSFAPGWW